MVQLRWVYRGKKNVSVHTTAMDNCDAFTEGKERFCSYNCDGQLRRFYGAALKPRIAFSCRCTIVGSRSEKEFGFSPPPLLISCPRKCTTSCAKEHFPFLTYRSFSLNNLNTSARCPSCSSRLPYCWSTPRCCPSTPQRTCPTMAWTHHSWACKMLLARCTVQRAVNSYDPYLVTQAVFSSSPAAIRTF